MRLSLAAFAALLALAFVPVAPVREFRIDAGHSDVAFSVGFLGHPVRGRFSDIRGIIAYSPGNPAASSVTVVIGTKSIATGSDHRDQHLRSADFFDVARYPAIIFHSDSITQRREALIMFGALTMHGITKRVVIPFREILKPIAEPHGSTLIVFSGALRLARKDFGIVGGSTVNDWFDDIRSATMADSVDITLDITGWDTDIDRTPRAKAPIDRIEREGMAPTLARLTAMRVQHRDSLANSQSDIGMVARGLLEHGKSADALALFRFVVETWPEDPAAHSALARAFELTGAPDSARVHTRRALALDALDPRALELARRLAR
jgi:polyisoprenoid-binding protein YceI